MLEHAPHACIHVCILSCVWHALAKLQDEKAAREEMRATLEAEADARHTALAEQLKDKAAQAEKAEGAAKAAKEGLARELREKDELQKLVEKHKKAAQLSEAETAAKAAAATLQRLEEAIAAGAAPPGSAHALDANQVRAHSEAHAGHACA